MSDPRGAVSDVDAVRAVRKDVSRRLGMAQSCRSHRYREPSQSRGRNA